MDKKEIAKVAKIVEAVNGACELLPAFLSGAETPGDVERLCISTAGLLASLAADAARVEGRVDVREEQLARIATYRDRYARVSVDPPKAGDAA